MPAFSYPSRTDRASVYEPPVDAHVTAMASARTPARSSATAALAAK
jgi:hypothetical protein